MIDNRYLELIHKDIDKEITPDEKLKLENYLKNNQEALKLYNELRESENLLDSLPEIEASENLKKRILNSINYDLYTPKTRTKKERKPGFTFSFTFGLAVGIIIIGLFISNPHLINTFDQEEVSGTMGLLDAENVASLVIDSEGVTGSIEVIRGSDELADSYHYGFSVQLDSPGNYELEVLFDPSNIALENISAKDLNLIRTEQKDGQLRIISENTSLYSVLFYSREASGTFSLTLSSGGRELYQQQVSVKH